MKGTSKEIQNSIRVMKKILSPYDIIDKKTQDKKNLATTSAGYLIDQVGLKGCQIGRFIVSKKHANFIINKGNGQVKDLLKLIEIIKRKIKEN